MKSAKYFVITGIVLILLFAHVGVENIQAVGTGSWSPDQRIPGYLDDTFTNARCPFSVLDAQFDRIQAQ